ncbi:MAG: hypothetical protein ACTSUE_14575 [Promethearchaeota archaeon]
MSQGGEFFEFDSLLVARSSFPEDLNPTVHHLAHECRVFLHDARRSVNGGT